MLTNDQKQSLCLKCRYCRKIISAPIFQGKDLPSLYAEFFAARKLATIYDDVSGLHLVVVPHVCAQLTDTGCGIYEKRPDACRVFDGRTNAATKDRCLWREDQ